ncbi:MAG: VWA domain-containing protein, partial [Planctomycetes bacterium]|nr:VWA domain-containing protein [Planctomycetota bacterium]
MNKNTGLQAKQRDFLTWDDPKAGEITLRIENPGLISLDGQQEGRGHYRAARFKVNLPEDGDKAASSDALFLLDTSFSSDPAKFNIWLSLLKETLNANRDAIPNFNVLFFSVDQHWYKPTMVANTAENVEALASFCDRLALEGATDLMAALKTTSAKNTKGRIFLLSDGAATWGDADRDSMVNIVKASAQQGLYAYRTGLSGSDTAALNALALASGGAVFSVVGPEEVKQAASAFRAQPWKIESVNHQLGEREMLEGRPTHVYPNQTLKLVCDAVEAKIAGGGNGKVSLTLSRNGERKTLEMPIAMNLSSHFAGRIYGQVATGQLEDLVQLTQDKAQAFARHFRITGKTCSLLMLESEADYQAFDIKPENDAFVVNNTNVLESVAKAEAELGAKRGSPKMAFQYWAKKLESMPGVSFKMDAALAMLVDKLPTEAFAVDTETLASKLMDKKDLNGAYRAMLESRDLTYASVKGRSSPSASKASIPSANRPP